jgi:hypothetical protein
MPRALKGGGAGKTAVQRLRGPKPTGGLKRTKLNPSWLKECGVVGQSILARRVCRAKPTPKRIQSTRPRLSKAVAQFNHGKPPVVPLAIQRMITPNRYAGIPFLSSTEMMQRRQRQLQLAGPAPVAVAPRGSRPSIPMPAPIVLPSAEVQQLRSELGKRKLDEIAARRLASVTPAAIKVEAPPKKKRRIITTTTNNNNYYNIPAAGVPDDVPGIDIDDDPVYVVPPYPDDLPPSLPFPSLPPIPVVPAPAPGFLSQAASKIGNAALGLASNVGNHLYDHAGKYLAAAALYKLHGYMEGEMPKIPQGMWPGTDDTTGDALLIQPDDDMRDPAEDLTAEERARLYPSPVPYSFAAFNNRFNPFAAGDARPVGWANSQSVELGPMSRVPMTDGIDAFVAPSTPIQRTPVPAFSVQDAYNDYEIAAARDYLPPPPQRALNWTLDPLPSRNTPPPLPSSTQRAPVASPFDENESAWASPAGVLNWTPVTPEPDWRRGTTHVPQVIGDQPLWERGIETPSPGTGFSLADELAELRNSNAKEDRKELAREGHLLRLRQNEERLRLEIQDIQASAAARAAAAGLPPASMIPKPGKGKGKGANYRVPPTRMKGPTTQKSSPVDRSWARAEEAQAERQELIRQSLSPPPPGLQPRRLTTAEAMEAMEALESQYADIQAMQESPTGNSRQVQAAIDLIAHTEDFERDLTADSYRQMVEKMQLAKQSTHSSYSDAPPPPRISLLRPPSAKAKAAAAAATAAAAKGKGRGGQGRGASAARAMTMSGNLGLSGLQMPSLGDSWMTERGLR